MTEFYAWCTETLRDHSLYALNIFSKCFEDRIVKILATRLSLRKENFPLLKILCRTMIVLHDIGKTHPAYQRTIKAKNECPKYEKDCSRCDLSPSFMFHEVLSAYVFRNIYFIIIHEIKTLYENSNIINSIWKLPMLAILQHHQSMRGIDELNSKPPYYELKRAQSVEGITTLLIDLLENSLTPIFPDINVAKICDSNPLIQWPSWFEMVRYLRSTILEKIDGWLKLYAILLGPLYICDNLSARAHRPKGSLSKIIREAIRSYPCLSTF